MLDAIKIAAIAVAFALGSWAAWQWQNVRYADLQHDFDKYKIKAAQQRDIAIQSARLAEKQNTQRVHEALDGAERREQKNLADAAAARRTAGGLRKQLAIYRSSLSTGSHEACRDYATNLSDVFGECIGEYQALAGETDRLGNAIVTLNASWPE